MINLFRSGTSQMTLMVTSSSGHHLVLHPRGLVPRLLGLWCQFRGDWSQRITTSTSESDFNILQARRYNIICHTIFFSLTTNMNHDSQNPRVPTAQDKGVPGCAVHGVCPFFFPSGCRSFISLSSPVNGYSEGRWQMANVGVHSYISTKTSSTSSKFLYSVCSVRIVCLSALNFLIPSC